jgi:hypothetical protein
MTRPCSVGVRRWVVDAAASVSQNAAGERIQMAIVQKAISQVQEIIQRSNGELNSIGGKIRGLDSEYQALGNQKFANKEEPQFLGPFKDDKPSEDERRENQIDAFRQVYGHDLISQNDWNGRHIPTPHRSTRPPADRPIAAEPPRRIELLTCSLRVSRSAD